MPTPTDRELVKEAASGDANVFGLFVRRHQKRIFRLALHIVRSGVEAEDVTQETFVRAYQALARFDGRSEPFTWLYRIAVNTSLNTIRSRKVARPLDAEGDPLAGALLAEDRPSFGANPVGTAERKQLVGAILDGMAALSDSLRTTLVLVCVDGVDHRAAAEVLGCPEGTVAWRVHEARRKLREFLRTRGFADTGGGAP